MKFEISMDTLKEAYNRALQNNYSNNLRYRRPCLQFDCSIRGNIAEIAFKKYIQDNFINEIENKKLCIDTNNLNNTTKEDIDISIKTTNYVKNIEIKTSLIPSRWSNINTTFQNGDIKIIKRPNERSVRDIHADIVVQIYYNLDKNSRDNYLNNLEFNINAGFNEHLNTMQLEKLINNFYFAAWIDKPTLIEMHSNLNTEQQTWGFGAQKDFWTCPLNRSKNLDHFIEYLSTLI